jgi:hypothetical protein
VTQPRRSQLTVERDRLVAIEEKRVEAEREHAAAMGDIALALQSLDLNSIALAIRSLGKTAMDIFKELRKEQ